MQHLICTTLLAAMLAGPVAAQSGSFPVFGPSAEREAFFEAQRQERIEREDALREERLERLRIASQERIAKAQAEAAAAKNRSVTNILCWPVPGHIHGPVEDIGSGLTVHHLDLTTCRTPRWRPYPYGSRTELSLSFGDDGFSAHGSHVVPGLSVTVDVD